MMTVLDLSVITNPAFWTGMTAVIGALGGFLAGRAGRAKILAEAEKIRAETKKLLDDQAQLAENRLHDQIMGSFKTLAELYERNLESMKATIDNMDREIAELRAENETLAKTVHELTTDKEQLGRTVDELRRNIDRLITALRNSSPATALDPGIEPFLKGLEPAV